MSFRFYCAINLPAENKLQIISRNIPKTRSSSSCGDKPDSFEKAITVNGFKFVIVTQREKRVNLKSGPALNCWIIGCGSHIISLLIAAQYVCINVIIIFTQNMSSDVRGKAHVLLFLRIKETESDTRNAKQSPA